MATQIAKGHIQGFGSGAIVFTNPDATTISGYVSPNLQTLALKGSADNQKIKSQNSGDTTSIIGMDDMVELTFDFIAEGATLLAAKASASAPQNLAGAAITGLPIISFGRFTDVLNTNGTSTQPWIFEMDAQVNGKLQAWEGSITLRRYPGITSTTSIIA
jgi:hypothetical protein